MADREVLPTDLKFTRYDLDITPNFESFTFVCKQTVLFDVLKSTNTIVLNQHGLQITKALVLLDSELVQIVDIVYAEETVTLTLPQNKRFSEHTFGTLILGVEGKMDDSLCGFYYTKYTVNGQTRFAGTTQFESHSARRAFVCADQPDAKAVFSVTLNVPKDLCALSNTSVVFEGPHVSQDALKTVKFRNTPVMSTYLLAWYIGELEYVETRCKLPCSKRSLTVRTYVTPGKLSQAQFANDFAAKVIMFFSDYFDIDYPLDKLDQIGVSDFSAGAMENWGLVTYRETCLLTDALTSQAQQMRVASVIAHELSHMWFGNLVTPVWWNELWLKEGFATYLEWIAVHAFFPEWKCWDHFVTTSFESALDLDELKSSHPINNEIQKVSQIDEMFDTISYLKGACMLRMLGEHLGSDVFKKGVRSYLKQHAYGNTVSDDLWNHLSEASNKNVKSMMDTWINQKGFPLITVSVNSKDQTLITQQPYTTTNGSTTSTEWTVPISYMSNHCGNTVNTLTLTDKWAVVQFPVLKVNVGKTAFFRVHYDASMDLSLQQTVISRKVSGIDRADIFSSVFESGLRGSDSTVRGLNCVGWFTGEMDYLVLETMCSYLLQVKKAWSEHNNVCQYVDRTITDLLNWVFPTFGYTYVQQEPTVNVKIRTLAFTRLALIGDKATLEYLRGQLDTLRAFPDSIGAINPNVRASAFIALMRFCDPCDTGNMFSMYTELYNKCESPAIKVELLRGMGATLDRKVLLKALAFTFESGSVRTQDRAYVLLAVHQSNAETVWNYIMKNWDTLVSQLSKGGMSMFENVVTYPMYLLKDTNVKQVVQRFLNQKLSDVASFSNSIEQEFETVDKAIQWYERDRDKVIDWVDQQVPKSE